jgi:hypothetical protein
MPGDILFRNRDGQNAAVLNVLHYRYQKVTAEIWAIWAYTAKCAAAEPAVVSGPVPGREGPHSACVHARYLHLL